KKMIDAFLDTFPVCVSFYHSRVDERLIADCFNRYSQLRNMGVDCSPLKVQQLHERVDAATVLVGEIHPAPCPPAPPSRTSPTRPTWPIDLNLPAAVSLARRLSSRSAVGAYRS